VIYQTVVFYLGEKFRWSLLGDFQGGENDEDSVVNDLEFYLDNYEAAWDGEKFATILEHHGWSHMRRVHAVQRNSGKVRQAVADELEARTVDAVVFLPNDTSEETAYWVIKAVMHC
jgi:hypothetical protein